MEYEYGQGRMRRWTYEEPPAIGKAPILTMKRFKPRQYETPTTSGWTSYTVRYPESWSKIHVFVNVFYTILIFVHLCILLSAEVEAHAILRIILNIFSNTDTRITRKHSLSRKIFIDNNGIFIVNANSSKDKPLNKKDKTLR